MLTPYGVGVLMFVWVLGRTFSIIGIIHASLFFKLNGCYLIAMSTKCTMICLTSISKCYEKEFCFDVAMRNNYLFNLMFWW